jgi:hypothetical protein
MTSAWRHCRWPQAKSGVSSGPSNAGWLLPLGVRVAARPRRLLGFCSRTAHGGHRPWILRRRSGPQNCDRRWRRIGRTDLGRAVVLTTAQDPASRFQARRPVENSIQTGWSKIVGHFLTPVKGPAFQPFAAPLAVRLFTKYRSWLAVQNPEPRVKDENRRPVPPVWSSCQPRVHGDIPVTPATKSDASRKKL